MYQLRQHFLQVLQIHSLQVFGLRLMCCSCGCFCSAGTGKGLSEGSRRCYLWSGCGGLSARETVPGNRARLPQTRLFPGPAGLHRPAAAAAEVDTTGEQKAGWALGEETGGAGLGRSPRDDKGPHRGSGGPRARPPRCALTSDEDLQHLCHQQLRVAVNCNDKALIEGGRPARPAAPARCRRPGTSGFAVPEVQAEQPVHGLLRGKESG